MPLPIPIQARSPDIAADHPDVVAHLTDGGIHSPRAHGYAEPVPAPKTPMTHRRD